MSAPLVYIIADYGKNDDMAFAEVSQSIRTHFGTPHLHIEAFSVPAFDTTATGFFLAQMAINCRLKDAYFYVNTAPRRDDLRPRTNNEGEGLVYAKLKNGVPIVAVNSGYSLSFIKDAAEFIKPINVDKAGSQFRSRDVFPPALAAIAKGDFSLVEDRDIKDTIPDVPEYRVGYVDGYGNIKTTIPVEDIEGRFGQFIQVKIHTRVLQAKISESIFSVAEGEMVLSPGSSGWTLPDGKKLRFVECVLRGGSAARLFGDDTLKGGDKVKFV